MSQPADKFPTPTDRIIWVGLAIFVPLGLGAWTYDVVRRNQLLPRLFICPFAVVAIFYAWHFLPMVWRGSTFNLGLF